MGRIAVRRMGARMMVAGAVAASMAVVAIPSAHAGEAARAAVHVGTAAGPPLSGEARALARAKSIGRPVPVPGETTATDTVTANPKGTLTLSRSLIPVRKWVNGAWRSLNATLRRGPDGTISTVLTTGGLALSGGGTGPMVTLRALGKVLAVSFPVPLPAPRISGSTATYAGVLPGVDLQVTAGSQGSASEVLIVHNAAAAADPVLRRLVLRARAPGLKLAAGPAGDITVKNPGGHAIFSAPAPFMWDSAPPPAGTPAVTDPSGARVDARTGMPLDSSAVSPGVGARTLRVGVAVRAGAIVLSPDRSMLTSASTRFPVYIDPSFTPPSAGSSASGWNTVNDAFPTTSNWKTTSMDLQVGDQGWDSPTFVARSFVNMPVPAAIYGSTIISAQLNLIEDWAPSCTATAVQAWLTGAVSSSTTWQNQPSWTSEQSSQTVAYGYTPCGSSPHGVGFGVANAVQSAANNKWTQVTFGIRAGDETDKYGWKKFSDAAGAITMAITYDHAPATPTNLSTSPATTCGASPPTVVGDGDVELFVPVSDPDGGTLGVTLQMWNTATGTAFTGTPTNPQTLFGSSGGTVVFIAHKADLEAAAGGAVTEFSWKAQVTDYHLTSSWSVTCNFQFDATRSGAPTITLPSTTPTIGQQASVTVTPPATGSLPTGYVYQLNGGTPQTVTADSSGDATITIVPTRFANQITVIGTSSSGNYGVPAVSPVFNAAEGAPSADADLTGDGKADLLTVGGGGLPVGLWLAAGHGDGTVTTQASDFGANGNGTQGDNSPADFTGAQAIIGHFAGTQFQDVLAYYPSGANPGQANILFGTGDGSPSNPVSGAEQTIGAGTFTDFNGDNPRQLANAGNTQGLGYPWPDLIGINGDATNGYYLDFLPNSDAIGGYPNSVVLTTATPAGGTDWNNWQIATAQLGTGTAMYLWDSSTGALYLWEGLQFNSATSALTYTQYLIANGSSSHWNQGASVSLHAADINGDGVPDLWTVTSSGVVTAYLATLGSGTATLAVQPAQTLLSATHTWSMADGTSGSVGTAADTTGSSALALTGSGSASWNTGDLFSPDVAFNGTTSRLAATGAAVSTNSGGFTVSAWADPASLGGTVLSQDMTQTASFRLYTTATSGSQGEWWFCMATSDTSTASYKCADGGIAQVGVWSHLTATYDPSTSIMNLYQGTTQIASKTRTALTGTTDGAFQVGDYLGSGGRTGYFDGQVAGVQSWSRVIPPAQVASPDGYFQSMTPTRFLDTRSGLGAPAAALASNGTLALAIARAHGIPSANVLAVAINVTATGPTESGFLNVYPDGEPAPVTSNVNFASGATVSNTTIVPVGPDGKIAITNVGGGTVQVVGDVFGYFTSDPTLAGDSTLTPIVPTRIMDTRIGQGAPKAPLASDSKLTLTVGGVSGIPSNITAVVGTLSVLNQSASGWITMYPDGVTQPVSVVTNFAATNQTSGLAIVGVANGKVDIYNGSSGSVNLLFDVAGYFTAGTGGESYHAIGATRLIDTRQHNGALASGSTLKISAGTTATALNPTLVLNTTAVAGSTGGWLTAYPDGASQPVAEILSYAPSQVVAGLVVTKTGGGVADITNSSGSTQLIIDCFGYFSAG